MTNTIEITSEVKAWLGNYEMLKSVSKHLPASVVATRDEAIAAFARLGFPTTKHEEWKYTSLRNVIAANYAPVFQAPFAGIDPPRDGYWEMVAPFAANANIVTLVDGHFDSHLSNLHSEDITICSLRSALENGNANALKHYGQTAGFADRALVALNTAMATDGVFVHVGKKVQAELPIVIVHFALGDQRVSQGRSLVVLDEFAKANVIEIWYNWYQKAQWNNHVSEIVVGVGANLEWTSIQNNCADSNVTNFTQVVQAKDSVFQSNVMSTNGKLIRNDLQARHIGTGCESHFYGVTALKGETLVDHHTLIDHAQPHCNSNENYKTILDGNSTAIFNGKVIVRPDAQKTNAFQSNKTLLLSEGATVNTKPQLEIFADDVKCSHGATTGRLDETALFYMRSRGLSEAKARALLTYAFGAEILEKISDESLRLHLQSTLERQLAHG
jgi:Fe-S cluster assembly protein SufD